MRECEVSRDFKRSEREVKYSPVNHYRRKYEPEMNSGSRMQNDQRTDQMMCRLHLIDSHDCDDNAVKYSGVVQYVVHAHRHAHTTGTGSG